MRNLSERGWLGKQGLRRGGPDSRISGKKRGEPSLFINVGKRFQNDLNGFSLIKDIEILY